MTREEAINGLKAIKQFFLFTYHEFEESDLKAIDMAIEALQREEAEEKGYCHRIKPKEYFSTDAEWIPCSERLPKEKQEVYVTVYFIEGYTGRAYGYMDGFGKWHLFSAVEGTLNSGYEVIAWMPLPKPYKGGDTE